MIKNKTVKRGVARFMNKTVISRVVSVLFTLAAAVLIFFFSAQNAVESGETSNSFIKHIAEIFVRSFRSLSPEEKYEFAENFQAAVRTLAHFSVFGLLGFSVFATERSFGHKNYKAYAVGIAFCFLYAVSDEVHQYFVPGRSAQLVDIAVDTAGSIVGACAFLIICRLFSKIMRRKKNDPKADTE